MNLTTAIQRMRLARQAKQPFGIVFYAATKPFGLRKIECCTIETIIWQFTTHKRQ